MGYRGLATGGVAVWLVATLFSRLPVAMMPLALVFFAREAPGGYAVGAVLAAVYTIAETVGALVFGARLRGSFLRRPLGIGLLISAFAVGVFALVPDAPLVVHILLTVVAGAPAAIAPGSLRSLVTGLVAENDVPRALSVDTMLNQAAWALSPAIVSVLALRFDASLPFAVAAVSTALSALAVWRLPAGKPVPETPATGRRRALWSAWPVYLTSAAAMYLLATAELTLPALLEDRGVAVGWAGALLTGFAVASIVGGFCYGLRDRWPGSYRTQSNLLLLVVTLFVAVMALLPGLPGAAIGLLLAGLFQAALLTARNLSLRERLPEDLHATGYSMMYVGSGVGYGVSGMASGAVLAIASPSVAVLFGVGVTALAGVAGFFTERRAERRPEMVSSKES
ncbi:Major Facilitator Superfamily protein [Amycolatopsis sp. YIM 10]|nr:Major Facilitator Superfamily protein [Amycolatopsis sp. YIM 10]